MGVSTKYGDLPVEASMKYAWIGLSTLLTAGALACSSNEAAPPDTGDG